METGCTLLSTSLYVTEAPGVATPVNVAEGPISERSLMTPWLSSESCAVTVGETVVVTPRFCFVSRTSALVILPSRLASASKVYLVEPAFEPSSAFTAATSAALTAPSPLASPGR